MRSGVQLTGLSQLARLPHKLQAMLSPPHTRAAADASSALADGQSATGTWLPSGVSASAVAPDGMRCADIEAMLSARCVTQSEMAAFYATRAPRRDAATL
jgi:hypothetical protein